MCTIDNSFFPNISRGNLKKNQIKNDHKYDFSKRFYITQHF